MTMTIKNDKLSTIAVITLGLGLFAGLGMVIPANADHIPNGLEIYYDFDEGSGTKTIDDSGHGTNGTHAADNTSSGPEYEVGQRGTTNIAPVLGNVDALYFNGTDKDYIINDTLDNFPTQNFTISFWINSTDQNGQGNSDGVISYATGASANTFILVLTNDNVDDADPNEIRIAMGGAVDNTDVIVPPNVWNHVAVTWGCESCDDTDGILEVFLNGDVMYTNSTFKADTRSSSGSLVIGADQDGAGPVFSRDQFLNGTLDDIRIYDGILSDKDIATLAMPSIQYAEIEEIIDAGHTFGPINKQLLVDSAIWDAGNLEQTHIWWVNNTSCDGVTIEPDHLSVYVGDPINFTESFNNTNDGLINPGHIGCSLTFWNGTFVDNNTDGDTPIADETISITALGTMGFWKNHLDVASDHLPIRLGDEQGDNVNVTNTDDVTEVFDNHRGKTGANKLAAQLLATAFNIWALMVDDAPTETYECIENSVEWSNGTLSELGYDSIGENGSPQDIKPIKKEISANHTGLDNYNNDGCPLP